MIEEDETADSLAESRVDAAIASIAGGGFALVTDDSDREGEGDLIIAAEAATTERIAFMLRHTSGLVCVGIAPERADYLDLAPMVLDNRESQGTAFTVSVDLARGVTTGISAADRAATIAALADSRITAADFVRPGHVFPLRADPRGVLGRPGHTEAAVDLAELAGLSPAGALCEVVSDDRTGMARPSELHQLAVRERIPLISIADLRQFRGTRSVQVTLQSEAPVPTAHGSFVCQAWRSAADGLDHIVLIRGNPIAAQPTLVRVHSECLTGEVFGSRRCDCGAQLDAAMREIAEAGAGMVIYLRGQEGRGIGIAEKLRAYELQDAGFDTVDANRELGLPVDARDYRVAAAILGQLGIRSIRLMTGNPVKKHELELAGLEIVECVDLHCEPTSESLSYLRTKQRRLGHRIPQLDGMRG